MCDTLCSIGRERTLFAKNSDRPLSEAQVVEAHAPRLAGGRIRTSYLELDDAGATAVLGSRPTWMWGFEHGVSAQRVAIGNEKLYTAKSPKAEPPALLGMDLVRLGLERGRSATDALATITDLLERHGQGGSGEPDHDEPYFSSFLVADPSNAWILETSARSWAAKPVEHGASISNRVTLGTDWTRASQDVAPGTDIDSWRHPEWPTDIADHRLAATRACVATGAPAIEPSTVVATLRHHGDRPWGSPGDDPDDWSPPPDDLSDDLSGITVCMHVRDYQVTNSSMVAVLPVDPTMPLRAWVALGSPCASLYVPMFPPGRVVSELADAAVWSRFVALRKRVEADAGALGEIRSVVAPVEAELWENADAAAGDDGREAEFVGTAWGVVDAALVKLGV